MSFTIWFILFAPHDLQFLAERLSPSDVFEDVDVDAARAEDGLEMQHRGTPVAGNRSTCCLQEGAPPQVQATIDRMPAKFDRANAAADLVLLETIIDDYKVDLLESAWSSCLDKCDAEKNLKERYKLAIQKFDAQTKADGDALRTFLEVTPLGKKWHADDYNKLKALKFFLDVDRVAESSIASGQRTVALKLQQTIAKKAEKARRVVENTKFLAKADATALQENLKKLKQAALEAKAGEAKPLEAVADGANDAVDCLAKYETINKFPWILCSTGTATQKFARELWEEYRAEEARAQQLATNTKNEGDTSVQAAAVSLAKELPKKIESDDWDSMADWIEKHNELEVVLKHREEAGMPISLTVLTSEIAKATGSNYEEYQRNVLILKENVASKENAITQEIQKDMDNVSLDDEEGLLAATKKAAESWLLSKTNLSQAEKTFVEKFMFDTQTALDARIADRELIENTQTFQAIKDAMAEVDYECAYVDLNITDKIRVCNSIRAMQNTRENFKVAEGDDVDKRASAIKLLATDEYELLSQSMLKKQFDAAMGHAEHILSLAKGAPVQVKDVERVRDELTASGDAISDFYNNFKDPDATQASKPIRHIDGYMQHLRAEIAHMSQGPLKNIKTVSSSRSLKGGSSGVSKTGAVSDRMRRLCEKNPVFCK